MPPDDQVRLRHMLDAARDAQSFAKGVSRQDLDQNRQLTLAVVKSMEIIGEAANRISNEVREQFPSLPWRDIVAMRNRLVHVYYDVDLDVVWSTLQHDIPMLIEALSEIDSSS